MADLRLLKNRLFRAGNGVMVLASVAFLGTLVDGHAVANLTAYRAAGPAWTGTIISCTGNADGRGPRPWLRARTTNRSELKSEFTERAVLSPVR